MTTRIGILGCGRIGQVHAMTLRGMNTAKIVAVSDFFPDAAETLAKTCGAETRSTEAILTSDDIDAVVVGTPTDTHFDIIKMAAAKFAAEITITGAIMLGNICLKIIRRFEYPSALAASIYCSCLTLII